jgi:ankyrin repeat protein
MAGSSALISSVTDGDHEAVQLLLGMGCKVNAQDQTGMTPFHHAAIQGSEPIIMLLIEANASHPLT